MDPTVHPRLRPTNPGDDLTTQPHGATRNLNVASWQPGQAPPHTLPTNPGARAIGPSEPGFVRALHAFIDAVRCHIRAEEARVLPVMHERFDGARRGQLGGAFTDTRRRHYPAESPVRAGVVRFLESARGARTVSSSGSGSRSLSRRKRSGLRGSDQQVVPGRSHVE